VSGTRFAKWTISIAGATHILQKKVCGLLRIDGVSPYASLETPNFSSHRGTRVDLLVLHDCEGGYEGSV
jgi:hypothetical protein